MSTNSKEYARAWREKNREKLRQQSQEHYQKNKEKRSQQSKEYYQENKEVYIERSAKRYEQNKQEILEQQKDYYEENKEKKLEQAKDYYEANKEAKKKYVKEYRRKNLDKIREQKREYRKNNPQAKLYHSIGTGISESLKRNNISKDRQKWPTLVGYSIQELRQHLESQFDEHMSWDNYGSYWHVDHIKPQSWFTYTSVSDSSFRECWALSNLQPKEAVANMSKGNRFEG